MEYWKECISIAADECGLILTEEQLEILSDSVQGGFENYDMAHGADVSFRSTDSVYKDKYDELKRKNEEHEQWVRTTKPCEYCNTTGIVKDGWGRDIECYRCRGLGRV